MAIATSLPALHPLHRLTGVSYVPNDSVHRTDQFVTHTFVNNVRFLSMAAIIGAHALAGYASVLHDQLPLGAIHYAVQPLKFGTIGFFLISGYLLGERLDQFGPLEYLSRRLRSVFIPWVVWFGVFSILSLAGDYYHRRIISFTAASVCKACGLYLLTSPFWFVPNLLIALAIILALRKYLDDVRIGVVFFAASLFYGVNIYGHWIPTWHTGAVFGFVFYLWLGAWSARHFADVENWLAKVTTSTFIGLILLTLAFALGEIRLLLVIGSADPTNSLRISNQLFSVVAVLAIVRIRVAIWPSFIDVREHTFGLYLTHAIVFKVLVSSMIYAHVVPVTSPTWKASIEGLLSASAMFVITYTACLVAVRAMMAQRLLRWTIGLPAKRVRSAGSVNFRTLDKLQPCSNQLPSASVSDLKDQSSRAVGWTRA